MVLNLALYAFFMLQAAWFWLHCAKPALIHEKANPLAYKLVIGVTVLTIVVMAVAGAAWLLGFEGSAKLWAPAIAAATYGVVVALGHPRYTALLALTGGGLSRRTRRRP